MKKYILISVLFAFLCTFLDLLPNKNNLIIFYSQACSILKVKQVIVIHVLTAPHLSITLVIQLVRLDLTLAWLLKILVDFYYFIDYNSMSYTIYFYSVLLFKTTVVAYPSSFSVVSAGGSGVSMTTR